jgi:subtilase family serine protease
LIVDPPTVSESAPAPGASFTLSATVRNQGNGSSAFATLRYYRSNDSTITTGDTEVGTDRDRWVAVLI